MFICYNFWKTSDPDKVNYWEFVNKLKDLTRDYETKQKQEWKPVDPRDLDEALTALKEEANMNDINLWDLFITGSWGDVKGFIKEDVFKDILSKESIWLKTWEMDALLNHFYDPKSDCINCALILW